MIVHGREFLYKITRATIALPMDQVAQIRDKIDITSYLSEFLTLKKAGRNFKSVCPFHNEKSPSFMVSPERQMWHCFGCNKGGDIYTFLMEYEHVEFPEALRILAKRAGVELVQSKHEAGLSSKKERIYSLNKLAADYYHYILTKHPVGKKALEYLKERGVNEKVMETFLLGFAPGSGNGLSQYLVGKKKYARDEVIEAGLAYPRGRDLVDFFKGRLMFPLIDHRDNIVGFSGRILEDNKETSKYINTRETLVYHKGEHFYGLSVTKDAIRKAGHAIMVEGEFDVISCFQEGVSNVVAVKGTALTEMQVSLIGRYASKISICFDGDKAGQEAMKRSLPIIEKKGLQATVIVVPDGKDPDEALKKNPTGFKIAVKKDISVYDYLFDQAQKSGDKETAEGKKEVADAFLPVIQSMSNEIIKEHYLRKLSASLGTTYESIVKELQRLKQKELVTHVKIPDIQVKRTREEVLEEYLTSLILQAESAKEMLQLALTELSEVISKDKAYHKIFDHLLTHLENDKKFDGNIFGMSLPTELLATYNTSLLFPLPSFQSGERYKEEVEKVAKELRDLYLRERLKKVSEQIATSEKDGKTEELESLKKEYSKLLTLLHKTSS